MHPQFKLMHVGQCQMVVFSPWLEHGIRHGCVIRGHGATKETKELQLAAHARELGLKKIIVPNQVHGDRVLLLGEEQSCKGDGIIAKRSATQDSAVGVFTADCLPILVLGSNHIAAIHSGWRGLSVGIIERAIARFQELEGKLELEFVIGPCAGPASYEVGQEVIDAIDGAVFSAKGSKYLLDLPGTARAKILSLLGSGAQVTWCGLCTMSDTRFHSYRRDQGKAGRNLSFILGS